MAELEESVGKNWLVLGDKNTGKTHICKQIAMPLYAAGKRIIALDSRHNMDSYGNFFGIKAQNMEVEEFMDEYANLDEESITLVTWKRDEFDEVIDFCTKYVRNSCIMLDDLGGLYAGNPPSVRLDILMTPKNNCNDIFYQIHTIGKTAPYVIEMTDVYVLKQTSQPKFPKKVPEFAELNILMEEIIQENRNRPPKQKWAWRMYDKTTGMVSWENNRKIHSETTIEYFDGKI